jgi:hypothetical protein
MRGILPGKKIYRNGQPVNNPNTSGTGGGSGGFTVTNPNSGQTVTGGFNGSPSCTVTITVTVEGDQASFSNQVPC